MQEIIICVFDSKKQAGDQQHLKGHDMDIVEFDIRGQICPASLLVALKEVNARAPLLREGAVKLCFITDNRDATVTIPESASNMGYAVAVEKKDGYYRIEVSAKNV